MKTNSTHVMIEEPRIAQLLFSDTRFGGGGCLYAGIWGGPGGGGAA